MSQAPLKAEAGDFDEKHALSQRIQSGIRRIEISLHGNSADMHDYHTASVGSFVTTVRGARALVAQGLALSVTTAVTRANYRHASGIVEVAKALGADAYRLVPARELGPQLGQLGRFPPPPELARRHLKAALRRAKALGMVTHDVPGFSERFA